MQHIDFYSISILARNWLIKKTNAGFKDGVPIEEAVEKAKKTEA